jgi:hypothetical protein
VTIHVADLFFFNRLSTPFTTMVALERAREALIAVVRAEQQRQYDERERALDRGIASFGKAGYPSSYGPGQQRKYPQFVSRGYGFGFGFGFGFW